MVDRNLFREGRRDGPMLVGTVLAGALGGLIGAAQALVLATVVAGAYNGGVSLKELALPLSLLLVLILLRMAANWTEEAFALRLAGGVQQRLRSQVLDKMSALGPVRMREERHGAMLTLLTEGLDYLEVYFQKYLPQLFKSGVLPVAFLIMVFPMDWITGLIMLITAPLVPVFMALIGQWTKVQTRKQWRVLSRMGGYFQDILEGLPTLKLYNRSMGQRERIEEVSEEFRRVNLRVLRWAFLSAMVLELLTTISIALISVGLGVRLVEGMLDFRTALFLLFLAPDFYLPLRSLGTQYHNSLNGAEAASDLYAFLAEPEDTVREGTQPFRGDCSLQLDGVTFAYPGGREALRQATFSLDAGEKLGVVGPSGSGKTTLLQLLCGFLRPGEGAIRLGGQDIGTLSAEDLHRQIAVVPQNPYLFAGTVLDNIRIGDCYAGDDEVMELCRAMGIDAFIASLPQGYKTVIGQGGMELSGGECQLVAIARACLKDAPIVLLDEATKNMDWQTDCMVRQALDRLTRGKTVIAVAHRLQTVASMDKILVLEEGYVSQFGSPEKLRKQGGAFARMIPDATTAATARQPFNDPPAFGRDKLIEALPNQEQGAESRAPEALRTMLSLCMPYKGAMARASLLGACSVAFNIALLGFSALLITRASYRPPILYLMTTIVAVRFFGIGRAILRYFERYTGHDATFRILKSLRVWYYDQMEKLSYISLQQLGMGRVFKHIIGDVDILKFFYLRVLTVPVVGAAILLGCSLFLGWFSPWLALLLVALFALGGLVLPWAFRKLFQNRRIGYESLRQRYSEELYDYMGGLADQEVYGVTRERRESILGIGRKLADERRYIGAWDSFAQVSSSLLANLALWASLLIMIPMVCDGTVSGLFLATVIWVAWAAFEALQPVTAASEYLNQSREALAGMEEAAARPKEPLRKGTASIPERGGITVGHLSFSYGGADVLRDVSFTLPHGSKTALVGRSGAGKTTLLNLLIGFLPYDRGSIRSGDVEFRELAAGSLRRSIGYLGQKPYLFHASVRENILIAREGASEEQIREAAEKARIAEFIQSLPDGYETLVGENGYKLSAGQRQRIALARLFLQDASIVILDEATQSLDPQNRDSLLNTLAGWWQEKTVLYITHDLYHLEEMDQVLVLEDGRIAEQGSASELVAEGGIYARLHALERDYF